MSGPVNSPPDLPPDSLLGLSAWLLAQADALRRTAPPAQPLAFWDFDGTLLEGDCTEGLLRADGSGYTGLAELGIQHGFSSTYRGPGGIAAFQKDYAHRLQQEGAESAYVLVTQIFAGAKEADLRELARQHFAAVMAPWFYPEMLALWHALEAGGVCNYVISASADFFVKGAAPFLGVPETRIHGLRLVVTAEGTLLPTLETPVTYGQGKAECLRRLLGTLAQERADRLYQPLFAVGNDPQADGPLLHGVAATPLPGGRPLAVLLNPKAGKQVDAALHPLTCSGRPLLIPADADLLSKA